MRRGPARKQLIIVILVVVWRQRPHGIWRRRRSVRLCPCHPAVRTGMRRTRARLEYGSTARRELGCILPQAGDNSVHIWNPVAAETPDIRCAGHLLLGAAAIFL